MLAVWVSSIGLCECRGGNILVRVTSVLIGLVEEREVDLQKIGQVA